MRRTTAKRPRTSVHNHCTYPPGVPRHPTPPPPTGLLAVSLSVAVRGMGTGTARSWTWPGRDGKDKRRGRTGRTDATPATTTDPNSGTRTDGTPGKAQTRHDSQDRPTKRHHRDGTPGNKPAHTRNAPDRTNRTNRKATQRHLTERPATRRGPPGPSRSFGGCRAGWFGYRRADAGEPSRRAYRLAMSSYRASGISAMLHRRS